MGRSCGGGHEISLQEGVHQPCFPPRGLVRRNNSVAVVAALVVSERWDVVGAPFEDSKADLQGVCSVVTCASHSLAVVSLSGAKVGVE